MPHNHSKDDKEAAHHYEVSDINHTGPKVIDPHDVAYIPGTPEEKALVRKIDRHLLPMLWVMYIFNYIDRTNIGVSSILGGVETMLRNVECKSRRDASGSQPLFE